MKKVIQNYIKNPTRELNLRQSSLFKSQVFGDVSYCQLVVTGVSVERCALPNTSIFAKKQPCFVPGRCRYNAH
jgi:hypothetical protein